MNSTPAMEATILNNSGVSLLRGEKYTDAISELFKGLNLVKHMLAQAEAEEMEMSEKVQDAESPDEFYFAKHRIGPLNESGLFTFRCPLLVTCPSSLTSHGANSLFYVKLSFVLLYNLALAHHLSAMKHPSNKKLRKAISLYELAYTVQVTEDVSLSVLHTMAIVNNLGQIHALLGSTDQSMVCFWHLLSTIMCINDCGEHPRIQDMDGFVSNVMSLILKDSCTSAPAA